MQRTALLLNPPGSLRYLRDCYCSSVDKANYYWQPLDLIIQSGFLKQHHDVELIDAIIDGLGVDETLAAARALKPDVVLSLTSYLSWHEDQPFFRRLKEETGALLVVSGDLARFQDEAMLTAEPAIDGVLLSLSTPHLARWSTDGVLPDAAHISHRENGDVERGEVPQDRVFSYPLPLHDLFTRRDYRFPFGLPTPYASLLTTHGCPYRCSFCNTGMLHFAKREWGNVLAELSWMAENGIRGLQVREATFNVGREFVETFCRALIDHRWRFEWFCNARADGLDDAQIALMARAGCRFAAFGVESGAPAILEANKQGAPLEATLAALKACRRHGIETLAHFVIGLPEETPETLAATRRLIRRTPIDFATFNVFDPRPGAPLLGNEVTVDRADRQETPPLPHGDSLTPHLSGEELERWKQTLYRSFYLRPGFFLRRLLRMRNRHVLASYLRNAHNLLGNLLGG